MCGVCTCARACLCVWRGRGATFWDKKAVVQLMKEELGTRIRDPRCLPCLQGHLWPGGAGAGRRLCSGHASSDAPLLVALPTAVSFPACVLPSLLAVPPLFLALVFLPRGSLSALALTPVYPLPAVPSYCLGGAQRQGSMAG